LRHPPRTIAGRPQSQIALENCRDRFACAAVYAKGAAGCGAAFPSAGLCYSRSMAERIVARCSQCDQPEEKCRCDRYCCICMGQYAVRLCLDGLYYCPDCREACEVTLAATPEH